MVKLWKIKRELLRAFYQISDHVTVYFDYSRQKKYDKNFKSLTTLIDGDLQPTNKIAIFHTYQLGDISKSVLHTCDYLNAHGYSIIMMSVRPLTDDELNAYTPRCWKILVRPNYGYDFGGYRDGLRVMREEDCHPDRLVILNDSMWLPTDPDSKMLQDMEASPLPFLSPIFENKPTRSFRTAHFQSYFYLFNEKTINSFAFYDYWKRYAVSDDKRLVLLRGEKGLSQALLKSGIGGLEASTRKVLLTLLSEQSSEFLLTNLQYSAYEDARLCARAQSVVDRYAPTEDWRAEAMAVMQEGLIAIQPMGVFPYACAKLLHLSFLKKSGYPVVHYGMRWQFLRAVDAGVLPAPHPDVLAEIRASRMTPRWTVGPNGVDETGALADS